jgi:methylglutaconyl-CoA hydratase
MDDLLLSTDGRGVATLALNRPERRNAFDDALIAHLREALKELEAREDVRVVVIRGNGDAFCAGGDIGWMRRVSAASFAENLADAEALANLMLALDRLSKPTIAYVDGAAYGGGMGLVACCDIAVATERARFCLSEAKLGLIPAAIGPFVTRAIGARRARRLMLTAETISAGTASELGLVHEVASSEAAPRVIERIVSALLACAPGAQADAKSFLASCEGGPIDADLMWDAARRLAQRRASPEGLEGLSAFLEKRPPSWRGGDAGKTPGR